MKIPKPLLNLVFATSLLALSQCGSAGDLPSADTNTNEPVAGDVDENYVLTDPSALNDIDGHKYEADITEIISGGYWGISASATTFAPNSYMRISDLLNVVLRITGEYSDAISYKSGLCPKYPTLSYAIDAGILNYSACPSITAYPTRNLVVKAMTRAFKNLDSEHKAYTSEVIQSYDGPNLGTLSAPYGVTKDYFQFGYGIDGLAGWTSSLSASSTTYGASKTTRGEGAAFANRILLHEMDSVVEPTPDPAPEPTTDYWMPTVGDTWYIQLQGALSSTTNKNVKIYDIDLFDNSTTTIKALQSRGAKVVCYFSGGSYENWRPDASKFPSSVKGPSNGWPGENILDIRRLDILGPIMSARMDVAVSKGCDGLDLDNMDVWQHTYSGFNHTYQDQINYNTYMAKAAHARGLSIGLKNDLEQIKDLVDDYDFAINESCYSYNECHYLDAFIDDGKAVLGIDYSHDPEDFCPDANANGYSFIRKDQSLSSSSLNIPCWDY